MRHIVRLGLLLVIALAASNAFAIDDCQQCQGIVYEDGSFDMWCGRPDPGEWGARYCEIEEWDTDHWYCQLYGNMCCVDPRM